MKHNPLHMGISTYLNEKTSIIGGRFSSAMFDYQRVFGLVSDLEINQQQIEILSSNHSDREIDHLKIAGKTTGLLYNYYQYHYLLNLPSFRAFNFDQ